MASQAVKAAATDTICFRQQGGNLKDNSMGRPYLVAASCNFGFGMLASFKTKAPLVATWFVFLRETWKPAFYRGVCCAS